MRVQEQPRLCRERSCLETTNKQSKLQKLKLKKHYQVNKWRKIHLEQTVFKRRTTNGQHPSPPGKWTFDQVVSILLHRGNAHLIKWSASFTIGEMHIWSLLNSILCQPKWLSSIKQITAAECVSKEKPLASWEGGVNLCRLCGNQ